MNLNKVVVIAQKKFKAAKYDKLRRGDILMHFLRDEIGITPEKFKKLFKTGEIEVNGPELEGDNRARFFLWYYINYVIDHLAEEC